MLFELDRYLGVIWFVFGDERYDPQTDYPLGNGFLTWRRRRQEEPAGARFFAGVYLNGEIREIHYQTPEYCECVRVYVSEAAERLLAGEQFSHSQFKRLSCPPTTPEQLESRMALLDSFEESVIGTSREVGADDPIEDKLLELHGHAA